MPQKIEAIDFTEFYGHWRVWLGTLRRCLAPCVTSLVLNLIVMTLCAEWKTVLKWLLLYLFLVEDIVYKLALILSISACKFLSTSGKAILNE